MARPTRFEHHRFVGDKRDHVVHDLDAVVEACAIDELIASQRFAAFGPDSLPEARNRGYRPCRHCAARAEAPVNEAPVSETPVAESPAAP